MKILVIVVTYNAMPWIERCFESLRHSLVPVDVYCIDNLSSDGTQEFIIHNYPEVIFHQNTNNVGFGQANNVGFRYAISNGYEFIYLLNQDAWILRDTISNMVSVSSSHPEYGVISPLQMKPNLIEYEDIFGKGVLSKQNCICECDRPKGNEEPNVICVKLVMAAHWLITRDCLTAVGGFSPSFPHYGEDNNFLQRVYYHGFKVVVDKSSKAVHDTKPMSQWDKQKHLYLNFYINPIIELSNPLLRKPRKYGYWFIYALYGAIKNHSIVPIKYYINLLLKAGKFTSAKMESLKTGAFL